jgi:hypothetical protein
MFNIVYNASTTTYSIEGHSTYVNSATNVLSAATYTSGGIVFTAVNSGGSGNMIKLVFNGTDSVTTVVNAWNAAYPTNTVGLTGSGATVLSAQSFWLTGGDGYFVDNIGVSFDITSGGQVRYTSITDSGTPSNYKLSYFVRKL